MASMSRNQRYEQARKAKGEKKVTMWIPENAEVEVRQMCEFLCENPHHVPYMARSLVTGKFKKAV
ncbi:MULTISPECIES: hypothetical protein [Pseudoalteromonas]|uniref:Uncharacterized protein n=3 Tax=Pseudoalteromonas TaxID=53246 RepID=A0ABZ0MID6_9GAMM|nr:MULTISPECIES: hypothetical protein [Pseudoalteromonas]WOX26900.1 hypothetical protein R5H13_09475 [Pseudoalteromonas maricaloris]WOX31398.1 hypothetical protein R5H13_20885 [Pseudoalteromonas maricaloris]